MKLEHSVVCRLNGFFEKNTLTLTEVVLIAVSFCDTISSYQRVVYHLQSLSMIWNFPPSQYSVLRSSPQLLYSNSDFVWSLIKYFGASLMKYL